MWYVIYAKYRENSSETRLRVREEHLARMRLLVDQGRVLTAGPMPAIDSEEPGPAGFVGSMIIAEFSSLDEAKRWVSEDVYVASGVWESSEVHPFVQIFP